MNCPYCDRSIGGYVQLGTEAYGRVSRGCCPHCGRSMPSGHSVGFAQSSAPRRPEKISESEFERNKAKDFRRKALSFISSIIGSLCLVGLIGGESVTVWGVVIAVLYFVIFFGIAYIYYHEYSRGLAKYDYRTGSCYHTTEDIRSGGYAVFVCIMSAIILIIRLLAMIEPPTNI